MAVSKYQQHFRTMARYNKWAYKLVFAKAAELTEEEVQRTSAIQARLSAKRSSDHVAHKDLPTHPFVSCSTEPMTACPVYPCMAHYRTYYWATCCGTCG
jgi:hypothetical protein